MSETTLDDDWMTVGVTTGKPATALGAIVRYKDYDAQLLDDGVLRIVLADRHEVHLFAPGEWSHFVAKPAPDHIAEAAEAEAAREQLS